MDTRTKIMETALELFSKKGYNGTGIQEIVDCSRIGKPTMYYYFGNKDGLLDAIFQEYLTPFIDKVAAAAEYKNDMTKTLTEVIRCIFIYASAHRSFYRLFISMGCEAGETVPYQRIRPFNERLYKILEELFIKGALQHGNMKNREREYALSLIGVFNVYALMIINEDIEVSEHFIYRVVHQFMHGIFS
jgi:AcrR family transcriptional regulator